MMSIGAVLGMIIGIVPGIAGSMGIALIMPCTFDMKPIHGIRSGPMIIVQQSKLMYAIFAGMMLLNLIILVGGKLDIRYLVKALNISCSKVGPAGRRYRCQRYSKGQYGVGPGWRPI